MYFEENNAAECFDVDILTNLKHFSRRTWRKVSLASECEKQAAALSTMEELEQYVHFSLRPQGRYGGSFMRPGCSTGEHLRPLQLHVVSRHWWCWQVLGWLPKNLLNQVWNVRTYRRVQPRCRWAAKLYTSAYKVWGRCSSHTHRMMIHRRSAEARWVN